VYILNAVKCVPPQNRRRPTSSRAVALARARARRARDARVILALGQIAWQAVLRCFELGPLARHPFAHGAELEVTGRPRLLASYHPSRQNTNTRVLTRAMWRAIFTRAVRLA